MATSARNLVDGSGTVSITSGAKVLTFSENQSFKEGTTINIPGVQAFTIDVGSGTTWTVMQNANSTASGQSFQRSGANTSRSRGGAGGGIAGIIVPNAIHYVYRAALDESGNPDWYFYFDTLFPENGVHPYTRDQYTGNKLAIRSRRGHHGAGSPHAPPSSGRHRARGDGRPVQSG